MRDPLSEMREKWDGWEARTVRGTERSLPPKERHGAASAPTSTWGDGGRGEARPHSPGGGRLLGVCGARPPRHIQIYLSYTCLRCGAHLISLIASAKAADLFAVIRPPCHASAWPQWH